MKRGVKPFEVPVMRRDYMLHKRQVETLERIAGRSKKSISAVLREIIDGWLIVNSHSGLLIEELPKPKLPIDK